MITCNKCGARVEDGMKYCDKCGSDMSAVKNTNEQILGLEDIKPLEKETRTKENKFYSLIDKGISLLPPKLTMRGDRTSLMIGLASLFALSFIYIICFFVFMSDICMPVSLGLISEYCGSVGGITKGASPLWIVFYFILNLYPVYFAVFSFFNKKYRLYSIFACAVTLLIIIFTSIAWALLSPDTIIESIDTYGKSSAIAWYAMIDCLSEAWYLKIILSLSAIFGIGVDYFINDGK